MKIKLIIYILLTTSLLLSCKKYLDQKSDQSLVVPNTLNGLQALLDYDERMNKGNPSWGLASDDNYFLPDNIYTNDLYPLEKMGYTWSVRNYSSFPNEWSAIYDQVYIANVVLEEVESIEKDVANQESWNNIKGSALVYRAQSFFRAITLFSRAYDKATAREDFGIVLRLTSDFNEHSARSNVFDSYQQILKDLKAAASLLPDNPAHVMRPSKPAAYSLLSRTYLAMREYDSAWKYSDLSLQINNQLMDYNDFNTSSNFPFKRFNKEIVFHNTIGAYSFSNAYPLYGKVDTTLYASYVADDLRKSLFFRLRISPNTYSFKGMYSGEYDLFVGIANDEVYLTRAECNARKGDINAAMADLNALLSKRWKTGTFVPFSAASPDEALSLVLSERRKELIFRDLRWMDIKRLNKEGRNIVLKRIIAGQEYVLLPNDNRYALPLPADIVNLTGIPQNP